MFILIAEDDDCLAELMSIWLSETSYNPIFVSTGAEAIAKLKQIEFKLIITDFQMPEVDGLDLLKWCRKNKLHMPVILTTASRHRFTREQIALQDCCAQFIYKPLTRTLFLQAVDRAVTREHDRDCLQFS